MNMRGAFLKTVRVAQDHGMPESPDSPLGLGHLRSMCLQAQSTDFSDGKLGRWLGWAQCAVVAADIGVTLDDMKDINRSFA